LRAAERKKRKQFFFEKKNQKTFDYQRLALPHRAHQYAKVFASFFKKKRFLASNGSVSTAPGMTKAPGAAAECAVHRLASRWPPRACESSRSYGMRRNNLFATRRKASATPSSASAAATVVVATGLTQA
jgi:hypothetical protein